MRAVARFAAVVALGLMLAACHPGAAANLKAAQDFLALNGKAAGVTTLPSGVQYRIVRSGPANGAHPGVADEVKVNYEGKLLNGRVFDSSFQRGEPAEFPLGHLIPAWTEALQQMRPGDEWIIYVPPAQGYGPRGTDGIPPNSLLIFRIQLITILPHQAELG